MTQVKRGRVFGLSDWVAWLDRQAQAVFGLSAAEFEREYTLGNITKSGVAEDLASVLPTIERLRRLDR